MSGNSQYVEAIEDLLRQVHNVLGEGAAKVLMTLAELKHFFDEEKHVKGLFTWTDLTKELLESTAGISPDLKAGSKDVMSWSRDKLWLVNHVLALPTEGSKLKMFPFENEPARTHLFSGVIEGASYAIEACAWRQKYPTFVPAAFPVKLGSGPSSKAPCFYSVVDVVPELHYQGTEIQQPLLCVCTCETSYATAASCGKCARDQLQYIGEMPVSGLSSASSAAAGWVHCLPPSLVGVAQFFTGAQFMPFVSSAAEGQAFRHGQEVLNNAYLEGSSQTNVDQLAAAHVHGLGDAGFVDSTGVAGAIARGATELVVFMSDEKPTGLTQLFEGRDSSTTTKMVSTISTLFGDDHLTVFSKPTANEVMETYENTGLNKEGLMFQALEVTNSNHVLAMKIGSITCTTADARWFGIAPGKTVKVHVISVETNVGMFFEDFFKYNEVVQEIMDSVMSDANAAIVSGTVLPLFF